MRRRKSRGRGLRPSKDFSAGIRGIPTSRRHETWGTPGKDSLSSSGTAPLKAKIGLEWATRPGLELSTTCGTQTTPCYGFTSYRSSTSDTCKHRLGAIEYTLMRNGSGKKGPGMATSVKRKSATDTLVDTMRGIIEDGARGMTAKERKESEKKFNAALDRAVAARKRRRETA
jgi:hypothetical protein